MMKRLFLLSMIFVLSGCGTLTGLPGHGGGKRFAIEQELIASSLRAAAKSFDLEALKGSTCKLRVDAINDEGSGDISGGRYSLGAMIMGDYRNSGSRLNTGSGSDRININIIENQSQSELTGNVELRYGGLGNTMVSPGVGSDVEYLKSVFEQEFHLKGINLERDSSNAYDAYGSTNPDPSAQTTDKIIFIVVDVFGVIRDRTDYHIHNQERLVVRASLNLTVFDNDGNLVLGPQMASYESGYIEDYTLWMGPLRKKKYVRKVELMNDMVGPETSELEIDIKKQF